MLSTTSATPEATLRVGDAREVLREIPSGSIHSVLTSPPYFGLRDYEVEGQLGLEETPEEYVANLIAVFRELGRVLRPDGTAWLNLGDTYVDKSLLGIPWRVAFALQAEGWILRSEIIWAKGVSFCEAWSGKVMPESARDRPSKAHEQVFLLTKKSAYFYDAEAVREEAKWERWGDQTVPKYEGTDTASGWMQPKTKEELQEMAGSRNLRSVWTLSTESYPGAHFAVMPLRLAESIVRLSTSEKGCCPECGAPWERETETTRTFESGSGRSGRDPVGKNRARRGADPAPRRDLPRGDETHDVRRGPVVRSMTTGWHPTCNHAQPPVPCVVLDPFAGSGTTLVAARRHGRSSVGIELNEEYAEQARARLATWWKDVGVGREDQIEGQLDLLETGTE